MIAQQWTQQLFGQMGTTQTGSSGGFLSSLLSMFFGARDSGGPVMAGGSYTVGESGPEVFVPATAGVVLPAKVSAGMGRHVNYNPTFVLSGPVDKRTQAQIASSALQGAQAAMARNA